MTRTALALTLLAAVSVATRVQAQAPRYDALANQPFTGGFLSKDAIATLKMEMRGMLAALGMQKGKPFTPDPRIRDLLDKGAKTAFRMAHAIIYEPLAIVPNARWYQDRLWATSSPVMRPSPRTRSTTSIPAPTSSPSPIRPARPWRPIWSMWTPSTR
jgi:hypothetical protein